jgi:hypothetical protein
LNGEDEAVKIVQEMKEQEKIAGLEQPVSPSDSKVAETEETSDVENDHGDAQTGEAEEEAGEEGAGDSASDTIKVKTPKMSRPKGSRNKS